MDVSVITTAEFNVNLSISQGELNQFLDELESVFSHYVKEDIGSISKIIEFKNLLTLSVNNLK
ncbi:hypothetical protein [Lysinibacillus pakistanensis]|uniref:hypothetical protein n=1 Tax=Lysinibacillus pakistanensis TaxID=759811 RepID=UPI003D283B6F